ncbi:NADPH oxidase 5 isoform X2 [Lepeophtheirus salmonis]|nr:NADPH oxidase 5-like [Lepeophtheirus salmonis]
MYEYYYSLPRSSSSCCCCKPGGLVGCYGTNPNIYYHHPSFPHQNPYHQRTTRPMERPSFAKRFHSEAWTDPRSLKRKKSVHRSRSSRTPVEANKITRSSSHHHNGKLRKVKSFHYSSNLKYSFEMPQHIVENLSHAPKHNENLNITTPISPPPLIPNKLDKKLLFRSKSQSRLLSSAERIKILNFRKFLRASNIDKCDLKTRVLKLRERHRKKQFNSEVDENGVPGSLWNRSSGEEKEEFLALLEAASVVLCSGEIDIVPNTFHLASLGHYGVPDKLYELVGRETDGIVTAEQVMEFIAGLQSIEKRSELTPENLVWLENVFRRSVGGNGEIRLEDFKGIVLSKNQFFVERVFNIFDKDDNGSISLQEFIDAMHQFAGQSPDDKIKFLFKVYDIDGDGLIQEKELQHVMRACMDENGMTFDENEVDELTGALFTDALIEGQNGITFEALKAQLTKHEGLLQNLSISIDRWLVPPKPNKKNNFLGSGGCFPHQLSGPYIRNNLQFLSFYIAYIAISVALLLTRSHTYWEAKELDGSRNWYTIIARASGQVLNFNSMLVLLVMCRTSITKLREVGSSIILPLDKHIYFHKIIGRFIFVYSIIHTLMHLINFAVNVTPDPVTYLIVNNITPEAMNPPPRNGSYSFSDWIFTSSPGLFGLTGGLANPTGVALIVILSIMILCSMTWVRKGGYFEIFYWSHLLYILYWILLILHGPNFWKWFIFPAILFAAEKVYRVFNSLSQKGKTWVSTGIILPSKVVSLVIKRPPSFGFQPGDYIFINIPSIAMFEWHPFTISSAPEQSDVVTLHIRVVGQWTRRLYEYFEQEQKRLEVQIQGGRAEDPYTTYERIQSSLAHATERVRKTSTSLLSTTKRLEENNNIHSTRGSADLEKRIKERIQRREELMRQRESMLMNTEGPGALGEHHLAPEIKLVSRSFRYMRRKPTIISYKPPEAIMEESESKLNLVGSSVGCQELTLDQVCDNNNSSPLNHTSISRENSTNYVRLNKPLVVYIDGPFGAPTSQIFRAHHAVLIGTGIGVTPFASILQSIMLRYWQARNTCPKCSYSWTNDLSSSVLHLRKVDFFWINRDQRSFEWFVKLLSQLEIEQAEQGGAMERFLDMHMYITSALQKTDMKAVGLQLALDLLHKKSKRDLITGLKTRTNAGRPNWDKVFKGIYEENKGKVTVFFCGSPQLGKILKLKCDEFGFEYRKENF